MRSQSFPRWAHREGIYKYISETGNLEFIDEVIPFANKEEGTVYEHLKRAVDFSMNHLGKHGMPAGLYADWNDCLRLGKDGESTFVALQFYYAMTILKEFAEYKKDTEYLNYLEESQKKLEKLIQDLCWNEDRFIRGFTEDGEVIGQRTDPEANMWLNPQSWSVISGLANEEQADLATVEEIFAQLRDEHFNDKIRTGTIVDISGGGIRFNSETELKSGDHILAVAHLANERMNQEFHIVGSVISCEKKEQVTEKKYVSRVKFMIKDDRVREDIIRYIFEEERLTRQKDKR